MPRLGARILASRCALSKSNGNNGFREENYSKKGVAKTRPHAQIIAPSLGKPIVQRTAGNLQMEESN